MLKSIRLKNFKLHEDTSIEAAPITVFIGPNNSGKSSVFQSLLALRQAAVRGNDQFLTYAQRGQTSPEQPYLFPSQDMIDLGDFKDVVRRGHDELEIDLHGDYGQEMSPSSFPPVKIELSVTIRDNSLVAHSGMINPAYGMAQWEWIKGVAASPRLPIPIGGIQVNFSPNDNFRLINFVGVDSSAPGSQPRGVVSASLTGQRLAESVLRLLQSLHPVFPIRGFEEWGYPLASFRPNGLDLISLSDRALALAALFAYDNNLEEDVSKKLEELMRIQIRHELVPPRRVTVRAKAASNQKLATLFANEGTGANQLPFILVPIALSLPNETILLSEPEAHLHPKKQSELTALLLTVAKKKGLQFFIETHSEHVLHKLLHAVAKGELAKDELALYYFENENGVAKARPLEVDERGGVKGGLPGFYDQSLDEFSDYLDALKSHKP